MISKLNGATLVIDLNWNNNILFDEQRMDIAVVREEDEDDISDSEDDQPVESTRKQSIRKEGNLLPERTDQPSKKFTIEPTNIVPSRVASVPSRSP
jgi:hypothetical protein